MLSVGFATDFPVPSSSLSNDSMRIVIDVTSLAPGQQYIIGWIIALVLLEQSVRNSREQNGWDFSGEFHGGHRRSGNQKES